MKNNVPYARFHGKKGRISVSGPRFFAFPLLMALLIGLLCGCGGQKAKDDASDRRASETAAPGEESAPQAGEQSLEIAERPTEGGERSPEITEQSPEAAAPSANDELTIRFNGISDVMKTINEKMQSFDARQTQILTLLENEKGGVSASTLIASLLLAFVLNALLTAFIIRRSTPRPADVLSLERKIERLEQSLDEQRKEFHRQTQDLQTMIAESDNQETLVELAKAIHQYTNAMTVGYQNANAQQSQAVRTAQNPPKKAFYQAFPPRSNAGPTILQPSEPHQPIEGRMSAGTLILSPVLDKDGKCSRDSLYSEQMMACFSIEPPDPVDSSSFYAVDILKNAEAILVNGRYELRVQGRLTARR